MIFYSLILNIYIYIISLNKSCLISIWLLLVLLIHALFDPKFQRSLINYTISGIPSEIYFILKESTKSASNDVNSAKINPLLIVIPSESYKTMKNCRIP